ncbi:hypothetical protein VTJ04DRAFT_274 [Mycothermus thermophilus]|uniref:uncharacterized protein n=1 Tax=Humicola insolens TaxID=85995 RepID=UPI0037433D48
MQSPSIAHSMGVITNMDNDTRGWILTAFSGLACILGASVICVDIPIRLLPGKRRFRIQESNTFLASSLSLSFGVMIFSALYSMLPSSMRYLKKDGWDKQQAGFLMMAFFILGFFGIQAVSRILHRYMPSHVVDCEHTHDHLDEELDGHHHHHNHHHHPPRLAKKPSSGLPAENPHMVQIAQVITEQTPLISASSPTNGRVYSEPANGIPAAEATTPLPLPRSTSTQNRRQINVTTRVLSFFKDTKPNCDENGPCYGYTDPCGQECFKHVGVRAAITRSATFPNLTDALESPLPPRYRVVRTSSHAHDNHSHSHAHTNGHDHHHHHHHHHHHQPQSDPHDPSIDAHSACSTDVEAQPQQPQHHHHVPTNGFLSIGLQTVIAIALHKFPEGFVTYATNHASPALGFNVFMALFVHNIAEGFSMALPLYMALGSRAKAVFWSSLLGGFSQPLGAGVAVVWLRVVKGYYGDGAAVPGGNERGGKGVVVDYTAYAVLFAITAGIMVSVALQLFAESLSLNHSRNLSVGCAFLGMTILGLSNALVSD